jgi:hypothetical protein
MRHDWRERFMAFGDTAGTTPVAIWIGFEPFAELRAFYAGFAFDGIVLAQSLSPMARDLGVYGTPTLYLLDSSGRLRYGILGDRLPPVDSTIAACTT